MMGRTSSTKVKRWNCISLRLGDSGENCPVVRSRDRDHVRAAAGAVLRALDDAVAAFVDSHQATRRELVRHEESLRREFIDDLVATKDGKVVVLVPGSVEGPRTRSTSPSWSNPNLVD